MMNSLNIDYHKVTPSMLESAMLHFGWSKIKSFPNHKAVWSSSNGNAKQWVPLDDSFDDYDEAVQDTIRSISDNSNSSANDVDLYLNQFFCDKDLVQLRVDAEDIVAGSMPLIDGSNLFSAFKKLVKGAFDEVAGSVGINELKNNFESAFFSRCELGQTAIGSYVVNAYLPVFIGEKTEDDAQVELSCEGVNLGRSVNLSLINRLTNFKKILAQYSKDNSVETMQHLLSMGFAKSDCEAIKQLFGKSGHRNWGINILWSGVEEVPPEQSSEISFESDASLTVRELVSQFKLVKDFKNLELEGKVVSLERDYGKASGKFVFRSFHDDSEIDIKVTVATNLYDIAVEAHEYQQYIKMSGHLQMIDVGKRKSYVMNQVEQLNIVQHTLQFDVNNDNDEDRFETEL